jgi:hypothetical protein
VCERGRECERRRHVTSICCSISFLSFLVSIAVQRHVCTE